MTKRPHRDIAASVRQRLLNSAKETDRPFNELLQYYAMERFLYRLTNIPQDFVDVIEAIAVFLGPVAKTLLAKKPFEATWKASGPWRKNIS